MSRPRFLAEPHSIRKLGVIATLLISMCAAVTGIPSWGTRKVVEGRFPCENCPCGCATADFCWDQCCCHSDAGKLAWAAENGVQPPAFLVSRVERASRKIAVRRSLASQSIAAPASPFSDAKMPASKMVQDTVADKVKPACCCGASKGACGSKRSTARRRSQKSESQIKPTIILLWKTAQCRGFKQGWDFLTGLVIDLDRPDPSFTAPPCDRIAVTNDRAPSWLVTPDPPVPLG